MIAIGRSYMLHFSPKYAIMRFGKIQKPPLGRGEVGKCEIYGTRREYHITFQLSTLNCSCIRKEASSFRCILTNRKPL